MSRLDRLIGAAAPTNGTLSSIEAVASTEPGKPVPPTSSPPLRRWSPKWKNWLFVGAATVVLLPLVIRGCGAEADTSARTDGPAFEDALRAALPRLPPPRPEEAAEPDPPRQAELPRKSSVDAAKEPPDSAEETVIEISPEEMKQMMELLARRREPPAAPPEAQPPALAAGRVRTADIVPNGSLTIRLRPTTREEGYQSMLVFSDEEWMEAVQLSVPENDVSLTHDLNKVWVKLRNPQASGDFHVVGKSGIAYRILFGPGSADDYDAVVTVRMPARPPTGARAPSVAVEMISAMYRRANPVGVVVYDGERELLYERDGLSIRVRWVYESSGFTGYVLEAQNTRITPMLIEQERFLGSGLLLVAAEDLRLEAGAATTVYLVFERGTDGQASY